MKRSAMHGIRFTLALALIGILGACGERAQTTVAAPVEITRDTHCSLDGMTLMDYPGPKAQIHYAQGAPDFFCDTVEMFAVYLRPEEHKRVVALYVNDMGSNDWDAPRGHWIAARSAFYVAGSKRRGPMGPTLASFAQQADAQAFARKQGGTVLRFDQITPDMVTLDGGVIKDRHM